jgi:GNAT superfamily N-acetyltransferase
MADTNPHFHIRPANPESDDADFILAAWDSTLPFLASIGAGEMWGSQPFSQREGQGQEIINIINEATKKLDGGRQFWIAETDCSEGVVKVGAALIRETLPGYLTEHIELEKHINATETLLYLEVLITDHRPNKQYKGAGKALMEALKQDARSNGRDIIYVDVWAGNNRRLNS